MCTTHIGRSYVHEKYNMNKQAYFSHKKIIFTLSSCFLHCSFCWFRIFSFFPYNTTKKERLHLIFKLDGSGSTTYHFGFGSLCICGCCVYTHQISTMHHVQCFISTRSMKVCGFCKHITNQKQQKSLNKRILCPLSILLCYFLAENEFRFFFICHHTTIKSGFMRSTFVPSFAMIKNVINSETHFRNYKNDGLKCDRIGLSRKTFKVFCVEFINTFHSREDVTVDHLINMQSNKVGCKKGVLHRSSLWTYAENKERCQLESRRHGKRLLGQSFHCHCCSWYVENSYITLVLLPTFFKVM